MKYGEAILVLELQDGYTEEDLKKKYKILARKYHPDNSITADKEKFIQIKEAYEFLMNNPKVHIEPDKNQKNKEICPMCNGTGKRRKQIKTARGMIAQKVQCQYCKGTGFK